MEKEGQYTKDSIFAAVMQQLNYWQAVEDGEIEAPKKSKKKKSKEGKAKKDKVVEAKVIDQQTKIPKLKRSSKK
jgi:hypothetical protein